MSDGQRPPGTQQILYYVIQRITFECFYGVKLFPFETAFFDSIGQMNTMLYPVYPSQLHFNLRHLIAYVFPLDSASTIGSLPGAMFGWHVWKRGGAGRVAIRMLESDSQCY